MRHTKSKAARAPVGSVWLPNGADPRYSRRHTEVLRHDRAGVVVPNHYRGGIDHPYGPELVVPWDEFFAHWQPISDARGRHVGRGAGVPPHVARRRA